jgi:hypothetical protein
MSALSMSTLSVKLERALGRTGVVGAGVLVACAAFWYAGVQRAERELAELQADLVRVAAQPSARAPALRPGSDSLANFYGYFATRDEAFAALQAIFAAAAAEGLELETGEYRIGRERGSRLLRYQIVYPVKGSYPKIRRFVARALNEAPGIALDDLTLRRDSAQASLLEARVQFTMYLGAGG